ncbi:hypothetical protein Sinac_5354 [Singulisphaera acidiphila DSM 18658]|uniref:Uncharacterized protein n=1 Tax=Singulisphaera acidiphila (strain ATCC BAA-1392 / DSM 18658 / VKM B-2454 / MOB10) TaxID=886293 RepID=L0DJE2_SINAD|nr:hypothetical protein Sinac_5354 [Singulisphaera acidiphila DSM 18658]
MTDATPPPQSVAGGRGLVFRPALPVSCLLRPLFLFPGWNFVHPGRAAGVGLAHQIRTRRSGGR